MSYRDKIQGSLEVLDRLVAVLGPLQAKYPQLHSETQAALSRLTSDLPSIDQTRQDASRIVDQEIR